MITANHFAVTQLRAPFRDSWLRVLTYADHAIWEARLARVHHGWQFPEPPEGYAAFNTTRTNDAVAVVSTAKTNLSLDELVDKFLTDEPHTEKDTNDIKRCIRRLKEFSGDIPARFVTGEHVVSLKETLWSVPKRLTREQNDMTFVALVEKLGKNRRRESAGVKKWIDWLNVLFAWAVVHHYMDSNPVTPGMKPKRDKNAKPPRVRYNEDDVAAIFSTPMYQGFGNADPAQRKGRPPAIVGGFRNLPGTRLVKDTRYWLALLALFMGFRVEEAGAATVAHIKCKDGIHHFDFTERSLKTRLSSRLVPLHPKIIELGFLDYVDGLRKAGKAFLFPDLPHDEKKATRIFSDWWGQWCAANAKVKGEGFDAPDKVFHSFRHSFKRACRDAHVPKEIHDMLTGHSSRGGSSGDYGRDADGSTASLKTLADDLAKVTYPTFPVLPLKL
jgi:integrase